MAGVIDGGSAAGACDHVWMNDAEPELSLLVIRAADLEASKEFYAKLGLRFQIEQHGKGPVHLSSTLGGTVFELYPSAGEGHAPVRLGFVVQSLDSIVSKLGGSAVKVLDRDGTRVGIAVDPDGNKVELTERRPGSFGFCDSAVAAEPAFGGGTRLTGQATEPAGLRFPERPGSRGGR